MGDTEQQIFSWTDTQNPLAITWLKVFSATSSNKNNLFVRNIRNPDRTAASCVNNVGSFKCIDLSEEKVAIGWGGHTEDGGARPNKFSVIMSDARVCTDHKIPNLGGRYSPSIGVIGKWLWACGGDTSDCKKVDLNAANPAWAQGTNSPYSFKHAQMYTLGDYLYLMGGYDGANCRNSHYRISATGSSWEGRAAFPRLIHRHRAVVDHDLDRIYVLGGHECNVGDRAEVYYYTPSSNSWTHKVNMPYSRPDIAAAIIKQKNDERWLMILRPDDVHVYYYNLDTNSGFHHVTNVDFKHSSNMPMLSLTPYSAFMLGAHSNHYGHSLKNFWVYNPENYRFEHIKRFIHNQHSWGYWTLANKNFRALDNCRAERTYAAVGWGGTDWVGLENSLKRQ